MRYGYSYTSDLSSITATILMAYGIFMVVWGLFTLAAYILRGIGFYRIAQEQGDENAWLAFVPFARKYQQGMLAGDIPLKTKYIRKTGVWFLGVPIAWGILSYLIGAVYGITLIAKMVRYELMGYSMNMEISGVIKLVLFLALLTAIYKVFYKTFLILIDHAILSRYTSGNMPIIHSVLSAFVPLYEAICFFVISRRIVKENERRQKDAADYETKEMSYGMEGYRRYTEEQTAESMCAETEVVTAQSVKEDEEVVIEQSMESREEVAIEQPMESREEVVIEQSMEYPEEVVTDEQERIEE